MKLWLPMLILLLLVSSLCAWDTIHTNNVFNKLEKTSNEINIMLTNKDLSNIDLQEKIFNLNDYWTKKMDTLCVSISRKDLQPVSDYLQYLCASIINNNIEDAITYSRLLNYNIIGLKECSGLSLINLL